MTISRFFASAATIAWMAIGSLPGPVCALPFDIDRETFLPIPHHPDAVPLDRDIVFEKVTVGPAGAVAAGDSGVAGGSPTRLIYSNTLGITTAHFPANKLISDDIATTAPDGCRLRRFQFKILGKVIATGLGGPFTVKYALYSNCPSALGSTTAQQDLAKIPGTSGEVAFPNDNARTVEHVIDPDITVTIPSNLFLGIQFDRGNCGPVIGSPASVGFSADLWDFPGFPCTGFFGGFPQLPHASLWAQVYGDETCAEAFPGYKAARASGGVATIGANVQGVDDVRLQVRDCRMVGYEVVVKGVGLYTFDLRSACEGEVIAGTQRTFAVPVGTTPLVQVARFTFDPPIPLPDDDLFLGFRCSSSAAGVVIAGIQPSIGFGDSNLYTVGLKGCAPVVPTQGVHGAVNLAITCAGQPPTGACCDMALTECSGGPNDGLRCPCNAICAGGSRNGACCTSETDCEDSSQPPGVCVPYCAVPGTCEAVCRELPHMNCQSGALMSNWVESTTCESPSFVHACGLAACCTPDDTCINLSRNQCDAVEPLDRPRLWQPGEFCYEGQQECPFNACLARQGDCLRARTDTGCSDPFCCTDVCDFDPWCCQVAWDEICLRWADSFCPRAPSNDQCAPSFPVHGLSGAFDIPVPGVLFGTNSNATISQIEPGLCCHGGTGTCQGGPTPGEPCVTDRDCVSLPGNPALCVGLEPMPGAQAFGTVWHKFVATHTTAKISACGSKHVDPRFTDSLIQIFAAQDLSTPLNACNSLSSVACNDDAGNACPDEPGNAKICVGGLTPGQTYYVLLGSKLPQYQGLYRLEITAPCEPEPSVPGDSCLQPLPVMDGVTPFDTADATFDCPAEACSPDAQNDLWFAYTATCTGEATFSTCGAGDPDTNIAVYDDCTKCPDVFHIGAPLACNKDAEQQGCFLPAQAVLPVRQGHCYKVRIADNMGWPVVGELTITCLSDDCQPNGIPDDQDIANCAPDELPCRDCNDNGVPDECDIRDDLDADLNFNGRIDACEICPTSFFFLLEPPNRVIDARRPYRPGHPNELEGIGTLSIAGFPGASALCWSLCETSINPALHPPYASEVADNAITGVIEDPPGTYQLSFKRPITPGETTIVSYTDDQGTVAPFQVTSHPGNVDSNATTQPTDLLAMIDILNGIAVAPWGHYSTDCDHSGQTTPADILCVIDLLNSGWDGTSRPPGTVTCP